MRTSRWLWRATVLALAVTAAPRPAQAAKEYARGNIKAVDLGVMEININGNTYKIARDADVKFTDCPECFPSPTLRDLHPPMYVHFVYEDQTVSQFDVKEIGSAPRRVRPGDSRPSSGGGSSSSSGSETLKVKILRIDERRGTFEADVAGRRRTFRADRSGDLRDFRDGDLAVITVERRGGEDLVTQLRSTGRSGRVTSIDERRGEIGIEVNGRERFFRVENNRMLDRVKVGDRVTFDTEDRGGREVLTSIDR
jgi:Cu/Ag efflux protein CusF